MRESRWIEPDRSLQPAVGFTAEEKLARLAAALEDFPNLAAELTKIADRVTVILGFADHILNDESQNPVSNRAQEPSKWIS
jgi:hypothetical protein